MQSIIGIDPGIVHTGIVLLEFDSARPSFTVSTHVVDGPDAQAVADWLADHAPVGSKVFVEKYLDRGTVFAQHGDMRAFEQELKQLSPVEFKLVNNTGVKQVVTSSLMKLLGVWKFDERTHHDDLRSAARIALYGALKQDQLRDRLSELVLRLLGKEVPDALSTR